MLESSSSIQIHMSPWRRGKRGGGEGEGEGRRRGEEEEKERGEEERGGEGEGGRREVGRGQVGRGRREGENKTKKPTLHVCVCIQQKT